MKKAFVKYWWIYPTLLAILMFALCMLCTMPPSVWETIAFVLLIITLLALPVSWGLLLFNKRWLRCIISVVSSVFIVCVLWIPLVMGAMMGPDGFAQEHPIPDGLAYNLPLMKESDEAETVDSLNPETFLQIWNNGGSGSYYYDFYYSNLPEGDIFLRCYEVTEDIPLSEDELQEWSRVKVLEHKYFGQVVKMHPFRIDEGDWNEYYAARIEVWYKNAKTNNERKLVEKIYRVSGWQR